MDYGDYIDREGPLSSIDLAYQRTRGRPSSTRGGLKRSSTGRPRGRPPKKTKKEDFDPSDTSESEVEDVLPDEAEQSSGDENDPEWRVGQKNDVPKRFKTKVNYNIKTLMQAEMAKDKITGPRPRGRPRGSFKSVAAPRLGQVIMDDSDKREQDFFVSKLPDPTAEPPAQENRPYGQQLDSLEAISKSSGGFRHFVRALEDAAIIEIFTHVTKRYEFPEFSCDQKTKDAIQIVQCLRHMWNSLPNQTRTSFELASRKKAIEDYKNGVTVVEDGGAVPSSLADLMEHVLGGDKKERDRHAGMPVSEMPFRAASKSSLDMVAPDCCSDSGLLKNFNDIKKHYVTKHYCAYLYACHFCNLLHESKEQLLKHSCSGFSEYMINRLVAGVVDDPQMTCAYMYLTCFECAFLLPLRDYKGERLEQAWNFFVTINNHHCGESLRLLVVFSLEAIKEETNGAAASFFINILPRFGMVQASCEECSIEFKTVKEANTHMLQHVQHTCTRCGAQFGTEAHFAHHQTSHIPNKLLFARYIRDNLTVYPPVHVKNALPRIGFADTNNVAFGGKEFTEENLFEFVNNGGALVGEKLNNTLHAFPLDGVQEETEGFSSKQGRHDMGLEEERQLNQPSQEQTQLVETLNKLFAKQIPEKRKLQWNAHLHNMEEMKKVLCQEGDAMDDETEIEAKELKCPMNYFLEDAIQTFTVSIKLPALACFDAISEGLLTKDFDLCTSCNKIYASDGTFIHDCPSESTVPIHRWVDGRRVRVNCHLCQKGFCSLFALRGHYAYDHLQAIDLYTVKKNETLMTVAMENLKKGPRSTISKATDAALHMEATRGLLRPKAATGVQHMAVSVPTNRAYQPRASYPTYRRGGYTPAFGSGGRSGMSMVPPFIPSTSRPGFSCKFCTHIFQDMRKMREHLRVDHSHICRGCGHAFAYAGMVTEHSAKDCSKALSNISMGHVQGTCSFCSRTLAIPRLYTHIFEDHLGMVSYGADDGRIYVRDTGAPVVRNIYGATAPVSTARIISSLTPTPNISCYLCGFEFDTMAQLKDHLDRHPEKWNHCPYCPSVVVRTHDDFKQHLLSAHYNQLDNSLVCKVCKQVLEKSNLGHILYHCLLVKRCAFCTDIRRDQSADELRTHLKTAHPRLFNRYQCSECKMTDPQLQHIKTHTCKIYDMEHQCYCGEVLPTRSAFVDHFWCHIDGIKQSCKLCTMKFGHNGQTVASHRLTHATVKGKSSNRKTTILDEELFMGKTNRMTDPQIPKPIQPASPIEVVDLDDEDDEMETADSPAVEEIIQEDVDEKIVRSTVRQLVKDVCVELGEEDEADNAALMANVRTESDDVTIVNQHPGYIDDDMDCHSPSAPTAGPSVVREINEDNDDEDICVVAEVDHPQGSTQSTVVATASRARKYQCTKCSQAFVTQASLIDHEIKSHRNDVGGMSIKVYGAPTEGIHYVCRNCSILFESAMEHRNHMAAHGPNPGMSCPDCSGFSYNTPLLVQHKNCHARQDKGRLLYGCGTCNKMFMTDSRLYNHLNNEHGVTLLFFCKGCSLSSYDSVVIAEHIQKTNLCKAFLVKQGCKLNQMMGCFPANMVHFQPLNQDMFEMRLRQGQVKTVTPSDCSHRSFLTPTDSVMSCKECHCTMPSVSFYANETYKNGGVPPSVPITVDESIRYPFLDINSLPTNRGRRQDYYTQPVRGRARISAMGMPPLNSYSHQAAISTPVAYTPRMIGTRTNITRAPVSVGRPPNTFGAARGRPRQVSSSQNDVVVMDRVRQVGRPSLSGISPFAGVAPSNKCEICNAAMNNSKVRRLHELHISGQDWFCLNCATGQKTEMDAVSHAFVCGFNEERKNRVANMAEFRPLTFHLLCLFDSCRKKEKKEYFSSLPELRAHINQNHSGALPFLSSCGQRFANRDMLGRHEAEHRKYEDLGIQTSCCNLCGVGNQWNQTAEVCGHKTVISHLATHGLHAYSMCRGCFTCFPHDYDYSKTTKHFEATHTKPAAQGLIRCMFCEMVMKKTDLRNHVLDKHIVRGYKPRHSSNYQLIVRTSGVTRQFIGMSTDGFEEEAEPASSTNAR